MNKKMFAFLVAVILQFGSGYAAHASSEDNSYLKIFTPYHSLKEVFSTYDQNMAKVEPEARSVYKEVVSAASEWNITAEEIDLLVKVVYAESKGEPYNGKVGVASVILNRLTHPDFPKSLKDVIFEKNAFSCIGYGYENIEPDTETYSAVNEALKGYDPTNDAVYFYNPVTTTSKWMKKVSKGSVTVIGNHVFFK